MINGINHSNIHLNHYLSTVRDKPRIVAFPHTDNYLQEGSNLVIELHLP